MEYKVISKQKHLCLSCMNEHELSKVQIKQTNKFKGVDVEYDAIFFYCDKTDELFMDEDMASSNDISMKNAYRKKNNLLTSDDIVSIRAHYGINQSDLCILLGWGGKTITRYEAHQVQDNAHDSILRKLDKDPEWFISLLEAQKDSISESSYNKYFKTACLKYESLKDSYLERTIKSKYICFKQQLSLSGNVELSLNKVVDVIRYFSNSNEVTKLYKVKLMKLLWYADALSFKRRGYSITGLVYVALPMGAVPIGHESFIDLSKINYEEIDFGEGTGYHFLPTEDKKYESITKNDIEILNDVISIFGHASKEQIIERLHNELAYKQTNQKDIILFEYTKELSIS